MPRSGRLPRPKAASSSVFAVLCWLAMPSQPSSLAMRTKPLHARVDALPWTQVHSELDARGYACLPDLLTAAGCQALRVLYAEHNPCFAAAW